MPLLTLQWHDLQPKIASSVPFLSRFIAGALSPARSNGGASTRSSKSPEQEREDIPVIEMREELLERYLANLATDSSSY